MSKLSKVVSQSITCKSENLQWLNHANSTVSLVIQNVCKLHDVFEPGQMSMTLACNHQTVTQHLRLKLWSIRRNLVLGGSTEKSSGKGHIFDGPTLQGKHLKMMWTDLIVECRLPLVTWNYLSLDYQFRQTSVILLHIRRPPLTLYATRNGYHRWLISVVTPQARPPFIQIEKIGWFHPAFTQYDFIRSLISVWERVKVYADELRDSLILMLIWPGMTQQPEISTTTAKFRSIPDRKKAPLIENCNVAQQRRRSLKYESTGIGKWKSRYCNRHSGSLSAVNYII